jgi:type II secretory pathway pseudopilin PulG
MTPQNAKKRYISFYFQNKSRIQGFMLVEVLVASLLTLALTGVAMQTIVAATAIRVRAQESSEATNWVQSDFEAVKFQANGEDMYYCPEGSTVVGCPGIINNYRTNLTKCNATSSSNGYAQDLKTLLGAQVDTSKASSIGRRPYLIRRTASIKDSAPYATLSVAYEVYRGSTATGTPMNTFYSEVIPGVALACR